MEGITGVKEEGTKSISDAKVEIQGRDQWSWHYVSDRTAVSVSTYQ